MNILVGVTFGVECGGGLVSNHCVYCRGIFFYIIGIFECFYFKIRYKALKNSKRTEYWNDFSSRNLKLMIRKVYKLY